MRAGTLRSESAQIRIEAHLDLRELGLRVLDDDALEVDGGIAPLLVWGAICTTVIAIGVLSDAVNGVYENARAPRGTLRLARSSIAVSTVGDPRAGHRD